MEPSELVSLNIAAASAARDAVPTLDELEAYSSRARALSDPTRLAIAIALDACGAACGSDVAWVLGRDDKLVSHHLRALKSSGAATSRRDGKMVLYELTPATRELLTLLVGDRAAEHSPVTSA